jgi:hypothetical protein
VVRTLCSPCYIKRLRGIEASRIGEHVVERRRIRVDRAIYPKKLNHFNEAVRPERPKGHLWLSPGDISKKNGNPMTDKDLLDIGLDLDVEPLDFSADFTPFAVDFSPELLGSEPPSLATAEFAFANDPEASLEAALARATPAAIRSAEKTVRYLDWKLGR